MPAEGVNLIKFQLKRKRAPFIGGFPFFQSFCFVTPLYINQVFFPAEVFFFFFLGIFFSSRPHFHWIKKNVRGWGGPSFKRHVGNSWGDIAAASVVVTLPLLIFLLFFQKYVVQGLTSGAVKE